MSEKTLVLLGDKVTGTDEWENRKAGFEIRIWWSRGAYQVCASFGFGYCPAYWHRETPEAAADWANRLVVKHIREFDALLRWAREEVES